jgi:hypothetical protein
MLKVTGNMLDQTIVKMQDGSWTNVMLLEIDGKYQIRLEGMTDDNWSVTWRNDLTMAKNYFAAIKTGRNYKLCVRCNTSNNVTSYPNNRDGVTNYCDACYATPWGATITDYNPNK